MMALVIAVPSDADASRRKQQKKRTQIPVATRVVEPEVTASVPAFVNGPAIALSGTYALTRVGNRQVRDPELAATRITFMPRYEVTGTTACNGFQGRLHTDSRAAKIVGFENITATEMGCPGKRAQAEATVLRILRDTANIARAGNSISLFAANGFLLAQFSAVDAPQEAQTPSPEAAVTPRRAPAPTRTYFGDYVLSELGGVPVATRPLPNVVPQPVALPNTRYLTILPTLYLRDRGTASGLSGCNQYTTNLVATSEAAQRFSPLVSTRKRCLDRPTERTEREFQAAFRDAARVDIAPNRVNLISENGTRLARFINVSTRRGEPPSLFGNTWILRSLNGNQVPKANPPSIVFEGNQVIGSTGCNRFNMVHNRRSGRTRFQDGAMTRMACVDRARSALETQFMDALGIVTRTNVTATQLTLTSEDARTILVFDAE